ncbi:MAG TPA: hypothetical protein VFG68_17110 [Fimbriiglobus sp.]|nr:hypothetical protein [Fimbriiglobus sp.]
MTPRERTLAIFIGAFIVVLLGGLGGYFGVYQPLTSRWKAARDLEDDIADKEARLAHINKDRPRLAAAMKRSLPANPDDARSEYDAAISRLLRDAKVPQSAVSIRSKSVDNRNVPEITPKVGTTPARPAYTKVALEVTLKPVSYATLIDVLYKYYRLDLLQQITKFNVKRLESSGSSARQLGSVLKDRADLEVQFVTEAVILDGAENRRTLAPVPAAMGAAGGSAGYGALLFSPVVARGIARPQADSILATTDRDYTLMLVKDLFHGLAEAPEAAPAKLKEDTSRFIRFTGVNREPDGTGRAVIEDTASHQNYEIDLRRQGGDLVATVVKHYFINTIPKKYPPGAVLDIADSSSSTARKFRVVGLDGDALILTEPSGSSAPPGFRRKGPMPRPAVPPAAAVLGGPAVVVAAPQTVLVWRFGESLSQVKALSHAESRKAVQRATADQSGAVPTANPTVPVATPPQRGATDGKSPDALSATSPVKR